MARRRPPPPERRLRIQSTANPLRRLARRDERWLLQGGVSTHSDYCVVGFVLESKGSGVCRDYTFTHSQSHSHGAAHASDQCAVTLSHTDDQIIMVFCKHAVCVVCVQKEQLSEIETVRRERDEGEAHWRGGDR